jgi:hypothetical protein
MNEIDLIDFRDRLIDQRRLLIGKLSGDFVFEPAFIALLANLQGAIAAVDAEMAEDRT